MTDILTAIQWLGTLAFAFVAIGYVEEFTSSICKKIFMSDDYVDGTYQKCRDELPDTETLQSLKPTNIDGKSTNNTIQALQRDTEKLNKEIEKSVSNKKNQFASACQTRSLSSISLYIVIACSIFLVVGGLEGQHPLFTHLFALTFSSFSVIYLLVGWLFGEKDGNVKLIRYASFRHSIWCVFIFSGISAIAATAFALLADNAENSVCCVWFYVLLLFIILGFLNFVVIAFKIGKKAGQYKRTINEDEQYLFEKCQEIKKSVGQLVSVANLSQILEDDTSGKSC